MTDATETSTPDDIALVDFLRTRDVRCPSCNYNLHGLSSPRCPECGRDLALSVGLIHPRQAAWLTGLIALAAGAGIGLVVILSIIADGWPHDDTHQKLSNFLTLLCLAMIPATAGWLIFRRRYLHLSRKAQWVGAAMAIVALITSLAIMAMIGF